MNLPLSNVPNHTKIWITKKERVGGGGGGGGWVMLQPVARAFLTLPNFCG